MTIRYTETEAQSLLQSQAAKCGCEPVKKETEKPVQLKAKKYDSGWEQAYAYNLDLRKIAGEIEEWVYKPWKFILAPKTTYEPDFLVVPVTGMLEIHEVKGYWRDDARVKWKAVMEKHRWFRFFVVKKEGSGWDVREEGD